MHQNKLSLKMIGKSLGCMAMVLVFSAFSAPADIANNENSVKVVLTPSATGPADLVLSMDGKEIEYIDFPKGKKFIQFEFPEKFSNYSIRVFEMNEVDEKQRIMDLYEGNVDKGIKAFDEQWEGKASSQQRGHEFNLRDPRNRNMVLQNLNRDGTAEGTLHDYILKFTVEEKTYLVDPQIRNRD